MTLEQLSVMSDDELNRLAAEKIHGWQLRKWRWVAHEGTARAEFVGFSTGGSPTGRNCVWTPATDRNQSGELLAAMAERGADFEICFRENGGAWAATAEKTLLPRIPGTSARSETIAALMAWFAMGEHSK